MSTATAKLALTKPDPTENADVAVLNANSDKIDAAFAGIVGAFKNQIRNGDFGVAQRGIGPFTAGGYTVDGWQQSFTGGTLSTTRVVNTLGNPANADGAKYGLQFVTGAQAAAGDFSSVIHKIEGVEKYAGKTVVLSFKAKASAGTPKIGVELQQVFGTGGAPSATVFTAVSAITISVTETGYSVSFVVPAITGKTLGSNGDDYLGISLWFSAGSTFAARASNIGIQNATITIYDVQLETGTVATAFERLPQQVQLAWCKRYYWRTVDAALSINVTPILPLGTAASNTIIAVSIILEIPMRATPTCVIVSSSGNDGTVQFAVTSVTVDSGTPKAFQLSVTCAGGTFTVGRAARLFANAAGGYCEFMAEL